MSRGVPAILLLLASVGCSVGLHGLEAEPSGPGTPRRPVLRWNAFLPEEESDAAISDLTYEVRVWKAEGGLPRDLVYRREGLREPFHRLEEPLAEGARCLWNVRARFRVNGAWRVLPWSGFRGLAGRPAVLPQRTHPALP